MGICLAERGDIDLLSGSKEDFFTWSEVKLSSQHLLEARLMLAILQAKRNREQLAVAMFSVDNFQWIVDTYGQAAGNELFKR